MLRKIKQKLGASDSVLMVHPVEFDVLHRHGMGHGHASASWEGRTLETPAGVPSDAPFRTDVAALDNASIVFGGLSIGIGFIYSILSIFRIEQIFNRLDFSLPYVVANLQPHELQEIFDEKSAISPDEQKTALKNWIKAQYMDDITMRVTGAGLAGTGAMAGGLVAIAFAIPIVGELIYTLGIAAGIVGCLATFAAAYGQRRRMEYAIDSMLREDAMYAEAVTHHRALEDSQKTKPKRIFWKPSTWKDSALMRAGQMSFIVTALSRGFLFFRPLAPLIGVVGAGVAVGVSLIAAGFSATLNYRQRKRRFSNLDKTLADMLIQRVRHPWASAPSGKVYDAARERRLKRLVENAQLEAKKSGRIVQSGEDLRQYWAENPGLFREWVKKDAYTRLEKKERRDVRKAGYGNTLSIVLGVAFIALFFPQFALPIAITAVAILAICVCVTEWFVRDANRKLKAAYDEFNPAQDGEFRQEVLRLYARCGKIKKQDSSSQAKQLTHDYSHQQNKQTGHQLRSQRPSGSADSLRAPELKVTHT